MDICQKSPSSDSVIEFSCDGSWLAMSENKGERVVSGPHTLPSPPPPKIEWEERRGERRVIKLTILQKTSPLYVYV